MSGRELVIANFNLHAGIDGWSRPFDYIAAAKSIDADVLVLEEVFCADGQASQARQIADALGYQLFEAPLGRLHLKGLNQAQLGRKSWGPRPRVRGRFAAVDPDRAPSRLAQAGQRGPRIGGTISIAILARVPVTGESRFDLPALAGDKLKRQALVVEIGAAPALGIVGTHLGHLSHGSPRQMMRLREELNPDQPTVLVGDMNCWGPPLVALLGAQRAVKGRTWPARHPHSQIDHILTVGDIEVQSGEVLPAFGSDHRPIRVQLAW